MHSQCLMHNSYSAKGKCKLDSTDSFGIEEDGAFLWCVNTWREGKQSRNIDVNLRLSYMEIVSPLFHMQQFAPPSL